MESKRARAALRRSRMSELANRSAVIALTMNNRTAKSAADLCAEYIRNETVSRRLYRPKMQDFPISDIVDKFIKGHVNLMPTGQRPMLRNASCNLVQNILFCNVMPASMIYNRCVSTNVYEVSDGLQRTTKILGAMMGMFPVVTPEGVSVLICSPTNERGWKSLLDSPMTAQNVKQTIEMMLSVNMVDQEAVLRMPVDQELRFTLSSISVSIQIVENWPPRAAACLAQLQTMNTTTHSVGETAYECTNALTMVMAKHEAEWIRDLYALGLGPQDKNKSLFLHTLRGVACTLAEVEFVNKANDVVGVGDFMSSIFHFMVNDLPDGYEQEVIVETFLPRLSAFTIHYVDTVQKTPNRIKKWKPDMIAAMMFMLAMDEPAFPFDRILRVLKRIESPRMNVRGGFVAWYNQKYCKQENLVQSMTLLFKDAMEAGDDASGDAGSGKRARDEEEDSDGSDEE